MGYVGDVIMISQIYPNPYSIYLRGTIGPKVWGLGLRVLVGSYDPNP